MFGPIGMPEMIVIFVIGVLVDSLVFGKIEAAVLRRRGLGGSTEAPASKRLRRRELASAPLGI